MTTDDLDLLGYEDPDENEWVLPPLPSLDSVPDNTSCFGPFFRWHGFANPSQAKVSIALTREITPPWRRGLGITLRSSRSKGSHARAVGVWWRGRPPRILQDEPAEKDLKKVVKRADRLDAKRVAFLEEGEERL